MELVQDSDETRVVAKTIDFKKEDAQRTRTFGRFMKIYPAFDKLVINEWDTGDIPLNEPLSFGNKLYYLGLAEQPIWGRKFKIRVKSKNTGKVVDLNVDFVLNKINSEENF